MVFHPHVDDHVEILEESLTNDGIRVSHAAFAVEDSNDAGVMVISGATHRQFLDVLKEVGEVNIKSFIINLH